jgi:hypothetical protein
MKANDPTHNNNRALLIQAPVHVNTAPLISLDDVRRNISAELDNDPITRSITTLLTSKAANKRQLHAWERQRDTLTYHGRLYVPENDDIRRTILRLCHDTVAAGHPGRLRTQDLVTRDFYWPGMSYFICSYVRGCATCQANKIDNRPPRVATMPNPSPERPFQVMTTDFITDLPECEGFTAIAVYVDRGYKMVYITPTVKTVDSTGASDLFMRTVFPHTGVMEQLISDRGLQFASKTAQHIYKMLGIKSSMSTAYHPQTDGQTERFNRELEQYLRIFCNYCQNDWVRLLPIAQFAHNSQVSAVTGKSPFQLLYGFNPRSYPAALQTSSWPAINDRLRNLHAARDKAQSALCLAADSTTTRDGELNTNSETYKVGDKVWLDGRNLKTTQPKAKLGPH